MSAADLLARDRFAISLGVRLVEDSPDRVEIEMDLESEHLSGNGEVDGGVAFSLADCAMSLISNRDSTALAVATHLIVGGGGRGQGTLRAVAEPVSAPDSRAVSWDVRVRAGDTLVARFTGTTLRVG